MILREWSTPVYGAAIQLFFASAFMLGLYATGNAIAQTLRPSIARLSAVGAVYLCVGLVAVGQGRLLVGNWPTEGILTPEHRSIWQSVERLTPPDALIFTDQTGLAPGLTKGWNNYAGTVGRQVYIAGWYQSRLFRTDEAALKVRLNNNAAILDHKKTPEDLSLSKKYSSYFAVISKNSKYKVKNFSEIFSNSRFVLYKIN